MKIKFDENISVRLVHAVRRLETERSIEIGSVLEDYGRGASDPEWMFRFREEGGVAMISGDHNILRKQVNLSAYKASGLISVWPPSGWPELKRWGQASLLLRWWPVIKQKITSSQTGQGWRLPLHWTPAMDAFKEVRDPRLSDDR